MCNRYASDIRKAGLERDYYGFDEWSETRINPILGNAILEIFPKSFGPILKLNDKGELVGLAFDGNKEGLASEVVFNPKNTRTIQVDARYMVWTMDAVDGADHLLKEMGIQPKL